VFPHSAKHSLYSAVSHHRVPHTDDPWSSTSWSMVPCTVIHQALENDGPAEKSQAN